jgi:cytochrome P450
VTEPITVPLICSALGVPRSDWPLFSRWAADLAVPTSRRDFRGTVYDVYAYVDVMVADRCRNLRGDLISKLIMAEFEGDELDSDELRQLVVGALMDVEGSWLAENLGPEADPQLVGRVTDDAELLGHLNR